MTKDEFIHKANLVHDNKYGYDRLPAKVCDKTFIEVYCPIHEFYFLCIAREHLSGRGCHKCYGKHAKKIKDKIAKVLKRRVRKPKLTARARELRKKQAAERAYRRDYVSKAGYDTSMLTDKQIARYYASVKAKEAMAVKLAQRKVERERKAAEQKAQREADKERQRMEREAQWIEQAKQIHPEYDYDEAYFEIRPTRSGYRACYIVNVRCPEHGLFASRKDVHINQRCKCPKCQNYPNNKSADERKQELIDRAIKKFGPNRFDYSQVEYVNKYKDVKIRCIEHNYVFTTRLDEHSRGAGCCPLCVQSSGEAVIRTYLDAHNIDYHAQWQIDNDNIFCNRQYLVIDFYVPQYNLFIEFNGMQHYASVPYFHTTREGYTLEDQEERDETVRLYCKKNKINLLEIRYDQEDKIGEILDKWINDNAKC